MPDSGTAFEAPSRGAMGLADEIMAFLRNGVADEGSSMDTGGGFGQRDFWVWVDGAEYKVTVTASGRRQGDVE